MSLVVLDEEAHPGVGTSTPLVVGLSVDAALAVLGGKGAMSLVVSDGLAVLVDGGAHPGAGPRTTATISQLLHFVSVVKADTSPVP